MEIYILYRIIKQIYRYENANNYKICYYKMSTLILIDVTMTLAIYHIEIVYSDQP